jgi:hypothetical protein
MSDVPTLEEEIKETIQGWVRERLIEQGHEDPDDATIGQWYGAENWVRFEVSKWV